MPFTLMIQADSLDIARAALSGVVRALAEDPEALSDPAPSDIVQHQAELSFAVPDAVPASEGQLAPPALPAAASQTHPAETAPLKRRGRKPSAKPSLVRELAIVEDVEPPPEVITEEDEPEAEGAVDSPEPEPETTGVSEVQLREKVRSIMDEDGIPAALLLLGKGGYKHVKDIPPADYDRVYAILLKAKA
jgi:hypothetical protein